MGFTVNRDPSEARRTCDRTGGNAESRSPDSTVVLAGEEMSNDRRRQDLGDAYGSHAGSWEIAQILNELHRSAATAGITSDQPSTSQNSRNEIMSDSSTSSTPADLRPFRDRYYSARKVEACTGPVPARCGQSIPWTKMSKDLSPCNFRAFSAGGAPTGRRLPSLAAQTNITDREARQEIDDSGGNKSKAANPFECIWSSPVVTSCIDVANACRQLRHSAAPSACSLPGVPQRWLHFESGNASSRSRSRGYRKYESASVSPPGSEPPGIQKCLLDTFPQNSHDEKCQTKEGPLSSRSFPILRSLLERPPLFAIGEADMAAILAIDEFHDSDSQSARPPEACDAPVTVTSLSADRNTPPSSNSPASLRQDNLGLQGHSDTGSSKGPIEIAGPAKTMPFAREIPIGAAVSARSASEEARPSAMASFEMQLFGAGQQQSMEEHRAGFDTTPLNAMRQAARAVVCMGSCGYNCQTMGPPVLVAQERELAPQPGSEDVHWRHMWPQAKRCSTRTIRRGGKSQAQARPTAVASLPHQNQSWPLAISTSSTGPRASANIGSRTACSSTSTPTSLELQQSEGLFPVRNNALSTVSPCELPCNSWLDRLTYPGPVPLGPSNAAGGQPGQTANWNIPPSQPWETPPTSVAPSGKQFLNYTNDSVFLQPLPRSCASSTARGRKRGRPKRISPLVEPARVPEASVVPPGGQELDVVAGLARPTESPARPQEPTPAPSRTEYAFSRASYYLHDIPKSDNRTEAETFVDEIWSLLNDDTHILSQDKQPSDVSLKK